MANSLPTDPNHGQVYVLPTNPDTSFKYDSNESVWKPNNFLPKSGEDSMLGRLIGQDHYLNNQLLTQDSEGDSYGEGLYFNGARVITRSDIDVDSENAENIRTVIGLSRSTGRFSFTSETQPTTTVGGALWFKPSTNAVYYYNTSSSSWIQL